MLVPQPLQALPSLIGPLVDRFINSIYTVVC
jgi:hypothetical protein